jgi:hypothetical protein
VKVLLHQVLIDPATAGKLVPSTWDLLIRQARHANLLGRLYHLFERQGQLAMVPAQALNHLRSAALMAERQHLSVRQEAKLLRKTLDHEGLPLILLKGAAYVVAGLPAAAGRVFADVDILVPKLQLPAVESALMLSGWVGETLDAYDQRYYRQWMHELPPMQHMRRGTALDVHHTILPPTSQFKADPAELIEASIEVPGLTGIRVLSPCDMVLHSAAHLFHEGEPDNLLRDLSDLDLLLRHFGAQPGFWDSLMARARHLGLLDTLRLALRHASAILLTPIPASVMASVGADRSDQLTQKLLDAIYQRVFRPKHSSTSDAASPICRGALYVRSHWLRMPPHLLAYHLLRKALRVLKPPAEV